MPRPGEGESCIARHVVGIVGVGAQVVDDIEPCVGAVAEDVLREKGRCKKKKNMKSHDDAEREARADGPMQRENRDIREQRDPQAEVEERAGKRPTRAVNPKCPPWTEQPVGRALHGGKDDGGPGRCNGHGERDVCEAESPERGKRHPPPGNFAGPRERPSRRRYGAGARGLCHLTSDIRRRATNGS